MMQGIEYSIDNTIEHSMPYYFNKLYKISKSQL